MANNHINRNNPPWVSSSDIGSAAYCPYSLYLAKKKTPVSRKHQSVMDRGTVEHQEWSKRQAESDSGKGGSPVPVIVAALMVIALVAFYAMTR